MAKREDVPKQNYNCSLKAYLKKKKTKNLVFGEVLFVIPSQFLCHCQ